MGASTSTNVMNVVTKTVANISTDIIQKTSLSTDSSQIISVSDIDGDVTIKDNVFYQTATINMQALMNALTNESAQQELVVQLSQEAKSLVSGLNIGQFSDASNTMNIVIDALINVLTVITQTCVAVASQSQEIVVKRVRGNVMIQNNVFDQVSDIISQCTQSAVANSSAVQDVKEKIDQSASATAQGLTMWAIVAIAALIIGLPVVGGIVAGKEILKIIFPIILAAGIILIVAYNYWTTTDMKLTGYSTFISSTAVCLPKSLTTSTAYQTAAAANDVCLKDDACVAYDWQGAKVNADGTYAPIVPPVTVFYSYVDPSCSKNILQDKTETIAYPTVRSGPSDPTPDASIPEGDAYINVTTSGWFQKRNNYWIYQDLILTSKFNKITVSATPPLSTTVGQDLDYFVYVNPVSPSYMYVYKYDSGWVQSMKIKGPGFVPNSPKITNASGFKVQNKKIWLLYLGIAALVLGTIGTTYTIYTTKLTAESKSTKPVQR